MRSYIYLYFHIDLVVSSECFTVNCKYCYQSPQNWCSVGFMLADIVLRFIYVRRLNVSATRGHHNKGEVVVTTSRGDHRRRGNMDAFARKTLGKVQFHYNINYKMLPLFIFIIYPLDLCSAKPRCNLVIILKCGLVKSDCNGLIKKKYFDFYICPCIVPNSFFKNRLHRS